MGLYCAALKRLPYCRHLLVLSAAGHSIVHTLFLSLPLCRFLPIFLPCLLGLLFPQNSLRASLPFSSSLLETFSHTFPPILSLALLRHCFSVDNLSSTHSKHIFLVFFLYTVLFSLPLCRSSTLFSLSLFFLTNRRSPYQPWLTIQLFLLRELVLESSALSCYIFYLFSLFPPIFLRPAFLFYLI